MSPRTEYFLAFAILMVFGFVFVDDRTVIAFVISAFVYCAAKAMTLAEKLKLQTREIEELREKVRRIDADS